MIVSQTALSAVTLGLFPKIQWKSRVNVFTETFALWKNSTKAGVM